MPLSQSSSTCSDLGRRQVFRLILPQPAACKAYGLCTSVRGNCQRWSPLLRRWGLVRTIPRAPGRPRAGPGARARAPFFPSLPPIALRHRAGSRRARFRCLPSTSSSNDKHQHQHPLPQSQIPPSSGPGGPETPELAPPRLFASRWVPSPRTPYLSAGPHSVP